VNSKGCILYKKEKYTLSNLKDASDLSKKLKIKPHDGAELTYDFFIKEMIKKLSLSGQLFAQLKEVNENYECEFVGETDEDRMKEFNKKAGEELECVYDIGCRKEDGVGGFSTWKANVETDHRIISLYKKVNSRVEKDFSTKKGAPHSLLLSVINNADCCSLKEKSKEYVSFMKKRAWHMFPYHIISEILKLIDESTSSKKKPLTDLFKEVLKINQSIATEPTGDTKTIGYVLKDNKKSSTRKRRSQRTQHDHEKKGRNDNGRSCFVFCHTYFY